MPVAHTCLHMNQEIRGIEDGTGKKTNNAIPHASVRIDREHCPCWSVSVVPGDRPRPPPRGEAPYNVGDVTGLRGDILGSSRVCTSLPILTRRTSDPHSLAGAPTTAEYHCTWGRQSARCPGRGSYSLATERWLYSSFDSPLWGRLD